jgi:hypothetical protein
VGSAAEFFANIIIASIINSTIVQSFSVAFVMASVATVTET